MSRVRVTAKFIPENKLLGTQQSRAFLGVSLNNRVTTNPDSIERVFAWVAHHVGKFDPLLGDYVHRHNYQAFNGMSERAAEEQSRKDGEHAATQLRDVAATCGSKDVSLITAEMLSREPEFATCVARLRQLYGEHDRFRTLIDETTNAFVMRKHSSVPLNDKVRDHCTAYQLEELVLFEMLADRGYGTFVYPGAQLPVMKEIVSGSLHGVSRALQSLTLVEIRLFEDLDL